MAMRARLETITPQIAAQYLAKNASNNRHLNRAYVDMLARDMSSGEFRATHQGIAFDEDGRLIDGQHRLTAVLQANTSVQMMVTRDCPAGTLMTIDRGNSRTLHDIMTITMGGDSDEAAIMRNNSMLSAMRSVYRFNAPSKVRLSAPQAMKLYHEYEEEWKALYYIFGKRAGRKRSPETAAMFAAMLNGVPADALKCFDGVMKDSTIAGCDGYNVQIALRWRRFQDDMTMRHVRLRYEDVYKTTQAVIKDFYENTRRKHIQIADEEAYPIRQQIRDIFEMEG